MNTVLAQLKNIHNGLAGEKDITLTLNQVHELPAVMGNHQNIEEVFSNLISNAIKYTPEGGQITITARAEAQYICISVNDTGFGIPPNHINRIFDRFYRVKDDQTRMITGTGLGLSIVKSIIEAHHGIISVESEPGRGSTFFVFFPSFNE